MRGSSPRSTPATRWLLALLVLGGSAGVYGRVIAPLLQPQLEAAKFQVRLERVADGDTLHLRPQGGGAGSAETLKVRLIGIDCPELGSAAGFRAAAAISLLCEGASRLELEPERRKDGSIRRDKYGRVLGWLWVAPGPDWPRQRDWLARYPVMEPVRNAGEQLGSQSGKRLLVQEELMRLGCAELYRDAAGSRYFKLLDAAAR